MVLFIFIIIVLIIVISELLRYENSQMVKKPDCPPHKWVEKVQPDDRGYLVCLKCGKLPGEQNEL